MHKKPKPMAKLLVEKLYGYARPGQVNMKMMIRLRSIGLRIFKDSRSRSIPINWKQSASVNGMNGMICF